MKDLVYDIRWELARLVENYVYDPINLVWAQCYQHRALERALDWLLTRIMHLACYIDPDYSKFLSGN